MPKKQLAYEFTLDAPIDRKDYLAFGMFFDINDDTTLDEWDAAVAFKKYTERGMFYRPGRYVMVITKTFFRTKTKLMRYPS